MTRRVYRSRFGLAGFIGLGVLVAVLMVDTVIRGGVVTALLIAPWLLLLLWATWVIGVATRVVTDASGVTVQNFLRRTVVGWGAISGVDVRYQLVLTLRDDKKLTCFGGPASATNRPKRAARSETDRTSHAAADLGILQHDWETARAEASGVGASVVRSWDWPLLAVLVALSAWTAFAVVAAVS